MKVYHSKEWSLNSDLHFVDSEKICPQFAGGYKPVMANYKLVAEIDLEDKEAVFMMTNHIDHAWTDNDVVEGIHVHDKKARSSSVGDLFEGADGQLWMVAGCGFEKVEWHKGAFKHYDNGREGHYLVGLNEKEEKMLERYQGLVNEYAEYGDEDEMLKVLIAAGKRNLLKRGIKV